MFGAGRCGGEEGIRVLKRSLYFLPFHTNRRPRLTFPHIRYKPHRYAAAPPQVGITRSALQSGEPKLVFLAL